MKNGQGLRFELQNIFTKARMGINIIDFKQTLNIRVEFDGVMQINRVVLHLSRTF